MAETNKMKKLLHIQSKLNAPKGHYNKFANYYFRSAEDILNGAKPLLEAEGSVILLEDKVDKMDADYLLTSTATLIDAEDGDEIAHTSFSLLVDLAQKGMTKPQAFGAASSYARKYALGGLLAVDDGEDADSAPAQKTAQQPAQQSTKNQTQKNVYMTELLRKLKQDKVDPDAYSKFGYNCPFNEMGEANAKMALDNYGSFLNQFRNSTEEVPF